MLLLIGVVGCRADGERAGDEAYVAGEYANAYAAYAAAARDGAGEIWAKAAAAAGKAGLRDSAVAAYSMLAAAEPTRRAEAADGLDELARAAERANDVPTLRRALAALRELAPERPMGRYAFALLSRASLAPEEAVQLLPGALAAAPSGATFDSLLLRYGSALAETGKCGDGIAAFRGVLRRSADTARKGGANRSLADCALELGTQALAAGRPIDGDRWFTIAARTDSTSATGRRALLGVGDARVAQGDTIAAMIVWQRLADRSLPPGKGGAGSRRPEEAGDSISMVAAARVRAYSVTDTAGDSARTGE